MSGIELRCVSITGGTLLLAVADGRPYIGVASICGWLGIDPRSQLRRVAKHAAGCGLRARQLRILGWGIALEELSWFLRTMRSRNPQQRMHQDLCALIIDLHIRHEHCYLSAAARDAAYLSAQMRPGDGGGRWTFADADDMRRLRSEGLTLRQIGERYGAATSTISLILSGKYDKKLSRVDSAADLISSDRFTGYQ